MFDLPTNKQENETREQSSQAKKSESRDTEIQEFAQKLDKCFERVSL